MNDSTDATDTSVRITTALERFVTSPRERVNDVKREVVESELCVDVFTSANAEILKYIKAFGESIILTRPPRQRSFLDEIAHSFSAWRRARTSLLRPPP